MLDVYFARPEAHTEGLGVEILYEIADGFPDKFLEVLLKHRITIISESEHIEDIILLSNSI